MAIKNRKSKIGNRRAGFTLIEILLAIGILAIGITAVLSLFMMGARSHQRASDRTRAALLADAVINRIKADLQDPHPDPACYWKDGNGVLWLVDAAHPNPTTPIDASHADYPEFLYHVVFTKLNALSDDYYKVKLVVFWGTAGLSNPATRDPRNSDTFETIVRRKNY